MKYTLNIREAGWLLGRSEPQIRRLIRDHRLEVAVPPTGISPKSVRGLFPDDAYLQLREEALHAVLDGRVQAPRPKTRYAKPAPITALADLCCDR